MILQTKQSISKIVSVIESQSAITTRLKSSGALSLKNNYNEARKSSINRKSEEKQIKKSTVYTAPYKKHINPTSEKMLAHVEGNATLEKSSDKYAREQCVCEICTCG